MQRCATYLLNLARRIHKCEQGAEGLEKLLIIAIIVLPLLFLLYTLRGLIAGYVNTAWSQVETENSTTIDTPSN